MTKKVFISYSHDSVEHSKYILSIADRLVYDGIDCIIDQYEDPPQEGWPKWMERKIEISDFVLIICTETYYLRVMGREEKGKGLGVAWESTLTYQDIYENGTNTDKYIPILLGNGNIEHIPKPLRGFSIYKIDSEDDYEKLYRRITEQPEVQKPVLGKIKKLSKMQSEPLFNNTIYKQEKINKIHLNLPIVSLDLFGREKYLSILDQFWESHYTNMVSIIAWGGVGKTSLVNKWLNQMSKKNYRGAERVYGWTFYNQGTEINTQASADHFIVDALKWFGDPKPDEGSPSNKAERLAELINKQRTLLLLDGLEPLQHPLGALKGRIKDQALVTFLRILAVQSPIYNMGLCIITSRIPLKDMNNYLGTSVQSISLEHLPSEACIELFKHHGIKGTNKEIVKAVNEFDGHALSLNLLATYVVTVYNSDILQRDKIDRLIYENQPEGRNTYRILSFYEKWLQSNPDGQLALNILYIISLFDGPAELEAIKNIISNTNVTELSVIDINSPSWHFAIRDLRELKLISETNEIKPNLLDCHPLIREYFKNKYKTEYPEYWKDIHKCLYEFYKDVPEKKQPDKLEEMIPLYKAITHGCHANLHQQTLDDIYIPRVRRGNEVYSLHKLCAFSSDLMVLSNFFSQPWHKVVHNINKKSKANILSWTGVCLRALGRLREAINPIKASLSIHISNDDMQGAIRSACNLSQLYLTLGNIEKAIEYAQESTELSEKNNDLYLKKSSLLYLADALHQNNQLSEAKKVFSAWENIIIEKKPKHPFLYSFGVGGFRFCDFLIGQGQYNKVIERASATLDWAEKNQTPFDIGLDSLTLGRAYFLKSIKDKSNNFLKASHFLNKSVVNLREAGMIDHLPRALLARAKLFRFQNLYPKAFEDINEILEISERSQMDRYIADYHIEYCHLCFQTKKYDEVISHFKLAQDMIHKIKYFRRVKEINDLQEMIVQGKLKH